MTILLIIAFAAAIYCLYLTATYLVAASQENQLPDLDDIELNDNPTAGPVDGAHRTRIPR